MQAETLANVHVACAACLTENRVRSARLAETPKCGKCGAELLEAKPVALDASTFDTYLERTGLPVLVDFWAPWCGPCRAMAPGFEAAAAELRMNVRFAKVNSDEAQALAARLNIRGIPTLILFAGGRETARGSGAMDKGSLLRWIARYV